MAKDKKDKKKKSVKDKDKEKDKGKKKHNKKKDKHHDDKHHKDDKKEAAEAKKDAKGKDNKKDDKAAKDGKPEAAAGPATRKGRRTEQKEEQVYVSPFSDDADEGLGFGEDQAADLADLEHMLNVEVDEDFFVEPRYFHTLRRVINVLGIHITDDSEKDATGKTVLERNPAYQNLQKQAQVVEEAIEHMSRVYCNALNRSVIQVGRIAREFEDAIEKVESLRRQLRVIQDTIGAKNGAKKDGTGTEGEDGGANEDVTPATHMSLRELWMKKLESEALLSLIAKFNVVRDAPGRFDMLTSAVGSHYTCRIGAAVKCLTEALETMFSDEVSQVEALSPILENLMIRKATAEEIIWETLEDLLYLRTSNGPVLKFEVHNQKQQQQQQLKEKIAEKITATTLADEDATVVKKTNSSNGQESNNNNNEKEPVKVFSSKIYNPFYKNYRLLCVEETDDVSIDSQNSGASIDSDEGEDDNKAEGGGLKRTQSAASDSSFGSDSGDDDGHKTKHTKRMMIPEEVVLSEVDLNKDELKCFDRETKALSKSSMHENMQLQKRYLPRYTDPVLSLRILVECLVLINRLSFLEEILMKNVEAEIKNIIHREQARTFYRLDRRRPTNMSIRSAGKDANELKDFRRHFTAILSSLGCIMMRYSHLAQIARARIMADEDLLANFKQPKRFLQPVLDRAYTVMQSELKNFLRACLQVTEARKIETRAPEQQPKNESKIFSFGVLEGEAEEKKEGEKADPKSDDKKQDSKQPEPEPEPQPEEEPEVATAKEFSEMPASTFVSSVLFPMTDTKPQVQHALVFRRSMDRFTQRNERRAIELAQATGSPGVAHRRKSEREELAIEFLDRAIQNDVNPVVQQSAINGSLIAADLSDAFDPPPEANIYSRTDKIQPLDVGMVSACEGMFDNTEPLFTAIHRLPPGGAMYKSDVEVMEFVLENFQRVVDTQIASICEDTTANELLEGLGGDKGKLSAALAKRDAFIGLMKTYEFDMNLLDDTQLGTDVGGVTKSFDSNDASDPKETPERKNSIFQVGDGLPEKGSEREEAIMKQESDLLKEYLDFLPDRQESLDRDLITRGELKKATCLAHSLLKLSSIMESRLKSRAKGSTNKLLEGTSKLHDNIKVIKTTGMRLAKFCHVEVLLNIIFKMAPICNSTTLCAPDAVRVPSSVNGVAEYITQTMEYLRESTSNAMAAYAFSNIGQYIPVCLMSTVRVIAHGEGIIEKSRKGLTMNGIESLDRSAAVLYKDLKAATGFHSQFFDIELTAISFERAATFTALMEMSIEELAEYYTTHSQSEDFTHDDYELMFRMDGPRRRGDDKQFRKLKNVIKKKRREKEEKKEAAQQATATS